MSTKLHRTFIHNVLTQAQNDIPLYGYKGAYQIAFEKLGMGIGLLAFPSSSALEEIRGHLEKVSWDWSEKVLVRFSYQNESNLPRAFDVTDIDDAMSFIARERKPGYAVLVSPAGVVRNSYEIFCSSETMYICVMPGKWEISTKEVPDILVLNMQGRTIYRYTQNRQVQGRRDVTITPPFSFQELEQKAIFFEGNRKIFECLRGLSPTVFVRCTEVFGGQYVFLNYRLTDQTNFWGQVPTAASRKEAYHEVMRTTDISSWDRETPILFSVTATREDNAEVYEVANQLRFQGIKEVYCNSVLSHQAIILREVGIRTLQSQQNYEKKVLLKQGACRVPQPQPLHKRVAQKTISPDRSLIVDLEDIDGTYSFEMLGRKGASLGRLVQCDFNIPPGFVLTTEATENLHSGLLKEVLIYASRKFDPDTRLIVRSSSTSEDTAELSYAGTFLSLLNIALSDLPQALLSVASSTTDVAAYERSLSIDVQRCRMAIVVQEMMKTDISGVVFSHSISSGNQMEVMMEVCYGLCIALVSHEIWPERYLVNLQDNSYVVNPHEQLYKYSCGATSGTILKASLNPRRLPDQILPSNVIFRLAADSRVIAGAFGGPQDIEFGIANDRLYYFQSRPISFWQQQRSGGESNG